jgi:hypothetical protein
MKRTLAGLGPAALALALLLGGTAVAQDQAPFESIDEASQQILAREAVTERAVVKHILVGWGELAPAYGGRIDPRAASRSREDADALTLQLLGQVRGGDPIEPLMAEHSEDPGSAATGEAYTATADAGLVPPFKALSLRLEVGETGLVLTRYGWHIIQRVE